MLFLDCTEFCKENNKTIEELEKAAWKVGPIPKTSQIAIRSRSPRPTSPLRATRAPAFPAGGCRCLSPPAFTRWNWCRPADFACSSGSAHTPFRFAYRKALKRRIRESQKKVSRMGTARQTPVFYLSQRRGGNREGRAPSRPLQRFLGFIFTRQDAPPVLRGRVIARFAMRPTHSKIG